jgi:hypothetical protein
MEPNTILWDGQGSVLDIILDLNDRRRLMTESQRALYAAQLVGRPRGRPPKNAQIWAISQDEAMERLGVSRTLLQMALTVLRQGVAELVEMVNRGEVAVSAAALVAELNRWEQKRLVVEGARAIKSRAAAIRSDNKRQRDGSESSTGRGAPEGDMTAAADQQPSEDSAAGGSDEGVGAEPDDSVQASAQAQSQSACRAEEAEEPADTGEELNPHPEVSLEATTQVENSPDSGRAVASALTTPKSDPCDQAARQATGKDLGGDLTVVAKPGTADPSPSPAEIPIEDIPLRAARRSHPVRRQCAALAAAPAGARGSGEALPRGPGDPEHRRSDPPGGEPVRPPARSAGQDTPARGMGRLLEVRWERQDGHRPDLRDLRGRVPSLRLTAVSPTSPAPSP